MMIALNRPRVAWRNATLQHQEKEQHRYNRGNYPSDHLSPTPPPPHRRAERSWERHLLFAAGQGSEDPFMLVVPSITLSKPFLKVVHLVLAALGFDAVDRCLP